MKQRFYIYRRRDTFHLQDSRIGKQQSLETKDPKTALPRTPSRHWCGRACSSRSAIQGVIA